MESDVPDDDDKGPLNTSRDSEQREIDEFEEEERRLLAEEEKVSRITLIDYILGRKFVS